MEEKWDDEFEDEYDELVALFDHHISVMDGKRALGEITEETYLLFLEHIEEYRKVLNG